VDAPLERVFDTLTHYENFPQFMTNAREVKVREDGSSHWRVAGPGGISVEWEAVTTKLEQNRLLAWRTVPGATVEHAGMIRFERVNGGTRLDIKMSYIRPQVPWVTSWPSFSAPTPRPSSMRISYG
jgi:uncharacterized membrane protein